MVGGGPAELQSCKSLTARRRRAGPWERACWRAERRRPSRWNLLPARPGHRLHPGDPRGRREGKFYE